MFADLDTCSITRLWDSDAHYLIYSPTTGRISCIINIDEVGDDLYKVGLIDTSNGEYATVNVGPEFITNIHLQVMASNFIDGMDILEPPKRLND